MIYWLVKFYAYDNISKAAKISDRILQNKPDPAVVIYRSLTKAAQKDYEVNNFNPVPFSLVLNKLLKADYWDDLIRGENLSWATTVKTAYFYYGYNQGAILKQTISASLLGSANNDVLILDQDQIEIAKNIIEKYLKNIIDKILNESKGNPKLAEARYKEWLDNHFINKIKITSADNPDIYKHSAIAENIEFAKKAMDFILNKTAGIPRETRIKQLGESISSFINYLTYVSVSAFRNNSEFNKLSNQGKYAAAVDIMKQQDELIKTVLEEVVEEQNRQSKNNKKIIKEMLADISSGKKNRSYLNDFIRAKEEIIIDPRYLNGLKTENKIKIEAADVRAIEQNSFITNLITNEVVLFPDLTKLLEQARSDDQEIVYKITNDNISDTYDLRARDRSFETYELKGVCNIVLPMNKSKDNYRKYSPNEFKIDFVVTEKQKLLAKLKTAEQTSSPRVKKILVLMRSVLENF